MHTISYVTTRLIRPFIPSAKISLRLPASNKDRRYLIPSDRYGFKCFRSSHDCTKSQSSSHDDSLSNLPRDTCMPESFYGSRISPRHSVQIPTASKASPEQERSFTSIKKYGQLSKQLNHFCQRVSERQKAEETTIIAGTTIPVQQIQRAAEIFS